MTKTEYLAQLKQYLKKLPHKEYQEAVNFFNEYFDEAGSGEEEALMAELGSPKEAAQDIIDNILQRSDKVSLPDTVEDTPRPTEALLRLAVQTLKRLLHFFLLCWAILLSSLLVFVLLCLILGAFALGISLLFVGGCLIWEAFVLIPQGISIFLMGFGGGLSLIGATVLLYLLTGFFTYWAVRLVKWLFQWIHKRGKQL